VSRAATAPLTDFVWPQLCLTLARLLG
jgi:hypothetical protein